MPDSPTNEEQGKLIEELTEKVRAFEQQWIDVQACCADEKADLHSESVRLTDLFLQTSAKLAASEETVRVYAEHIKAWVELDPEGAPCSDNEAPCPQCRLENLALNPPDGASALSENVKLRAVAQLANEMVNGPENGRRYNEIAADLRTTLRMPFSHFTALGERSSQEGEGS